MAEHELVISYWAKNYGAQVTNELPIWHSYTSYLTNKHFKHDTTGMTQIQYDKAFW